MKILFLSDDFPPNNLGGAGAVAYGLAKTIKELGHDVYVVSTTQDRSKEANYVQDGLKVYKIYSQYHKRWRAYLSLYNPQTVNGVGKIINSIKPDVVHAHNIHYYLSYYCLKIAKKGGAKVFLTAHDVMLFDYGKINIPKEATCENFLKYCKASFLRQMSENKKRYNPLRNMIIRRYLDKYTDSIVAVSDSLRKVLALNGVDDTEVIHNGIDVGSYNVSPEAVAAFKRNNGLDNKKIVLFSGRIDEVKGSKQLILALRLVIRKIPDLLLVVAGTESKDIYNPNVPVRFLGWLSGDNMKLALAASDVVVFPSICFETFGMVALEAMAAKRPVIGSCFGGMLEVIVQGRTGYLVNPYDIDELAEKTAELLNNPEKVLDLGEKGFERARDDFSLKKQAGKYIQLFNQV